MPIQTLITLIHLVSFSVLHFFRFAGLIGKHIVSSILYTIALTSDLKSIGYKVAEDVHGYGYRKCQFYMRTLVERVEASGQRVEQTLQPIRHSVKVMAHAVSVIANATIRNAERCLIVWTVMFILWINRRKLINCFHRFCSKFCDAVRCCRRLVLRQRQAEDEDAADNNYSIDWREQQLCVACVDKMKRVVVMPCRHLCLCKDCSARMLLMQLNRNCPICRGAIESFMEVFI